MMTEIQSEHEQFQGRIIYMSIYNNIVWEQGRNLYCELQNCSRLCEKDSRTDIGRFMGLDQKRNGTELTLTNRMENGIDSLRT